MNNVTWYVIESDGVDILEKEYYAGTLTPSETTELKLEVWNNKWNNTSDVNDIDANLVVMFENAEDSVLLNLCTAKINDGEYKKFESTQINRGVLKLGVLSGLRNNGSSTSIDNYRRITLRFENVPENLKDGLKSLYIGIQEVE